LLAKPNALLNPSKFWLDATSWLVRYGNYYAFLGRGNTGPVRRLIPLDPRGVTIQQDYTDIERITYRVTFTTGTSAEYTPDLIMHARGAARDGICGNSIIMDIRQAIALEIAAETFGAQFFGNGATPGLVLQFSQGSQGVKTDEDRTKLRAAIEEAYGKFRRHGVFILNKGMEVGQQVPIENEKAQFLATRQYQRTVIAGAFGVPPHLVGDLSKGTFNNVEQQSLAFVANVVQPFCKIFEDAMEQSLLTDDERQQGIIIRFDLDEALRADFKTRQEGLAIQRQNGALSSNEWRALEGRNPREGGDTFLDGGTSGQQPSNKPTPTDQPADENEPEPTEDDTDTEDDTQ
jgi:HK97 family phage portal protein